MKTSFRMLDLRKNTQNSPSALVQCCAKSRKAIAGGGGQEYPSNFATNIE